MASNLKMKNVMVSYDNDNSDDDKDEKVSGKKKELLDLPLEKLNLGPKKKLLVLSLGGLLVDRVHRRNESAVRRFTPDLAHGNFLDDLKCNMSVGLARLTNGSAHLARYDQDNCIDSGFSTVKKHNKPIFLKQLKKIWENNSYGGRFSEFNTLLIDDEPHVALLNPPNTGVFPPAYKVRNRGDTFLGPKGEMQEFLDGLVDANDVPTYVKGHPFGQPAITDSHSDWDYYVKIIHAAKDPGFGVYKSDSDYSD
ncbi:hypothetical protein BC332_22840 [Capsicum chinense]|nr:hypothetical protein BC332_22840 [Capsicum chinense]